MANSERKYIRLRTYDDDYHTAYIELIDHPHEIVPCTTTTIRVHNLIENYDGPSIAIDFDKNNRAIGIEILYSYDDIEDEDESQ